MKKALVIFSGGQDSTTCLHWAMRQFDAVECLTFDYGQRHAVEIESARLIAGLADVRHETLVVGPILKGASPLISQNELEQYADMHSLPGGLENTFVPGRNLLFLTLAANHAYSRGITNVVTGVCQEDFGGYPDCRQIFIDNAQAAIRTGMGYDDQDGFKQFRIHTPLMNLSKANSVLLAHSMPACWFAMRYSHTAYDGQYPPTGNDHASLLRAKGFQEAGLPDPLVERAVAEGLMARPETENYNGLPAPRKSFKEKI